MKQLSTSALLAVLLFIAVAYAGAANAKTPQEKMADNVASLISPFESHVAKVSGSTVYITIPQKGMLVKGALGEIVGADGSKAGFVKIVSVEEKYAVCDILRKSGEIIPGRSIIRGLYPPARVLWLEQEPKDSDKLYKLSRVRESVRTRGSIDISSADVAEYFLRKFQGVPLYGIPQNALAKVAQAVGADLIALSMIEDNKNDVTAALMVLGPSGGRLVSFKEKWRKDKAEPEKKQTKSAVAGTGSISVKGKRGDGFLQAAWDGSIAAAQILGNKTMDIREQVRWSRYQLDVKVLSASWVRYGVAADLRLAVLDPGGLRIMRPDDGKLKPMAEYRVERRGLRPVSVSSFDTDGDGKDEIFVNAFLDSNLASFVIEIEGDNIKVLSDSLPFYFSVSSDGALLAQRGARVFTVTRTGAELEFVPAFTLQGEEIPLGINRFDIDGDGTLELVGMLSQGRLIIFTQAGRPAWKGIGFGATGRIAIPSDDEHSYTALTVPPKVLPVKDEKVGLTIAVAGAKHKESGILKRASLKDGSIRFVTVEKGKYIVQDTLWSTEGWISDLIAPALATGPFAESGALGYIRVYSGLVYDESEIFLPYE